MARPNQVSQSPAPRFEDDLYEASPPPSQPRRSVNDVSASPSPSTQSISSDKENRPTPRTVDKGKGRAMPPPRVSSPASKRKRGNDRNPSRDRSQRRRTTEPDEDETLADGYDPDQSVHERRDIRAGLRSLQRNLIDNRTEFLAADSNGIRNTLLQANDLSEQVKQTADATIDSRLLVNTADLAKRKAESLGSGDIVNGIDVDDFVSRLKLYMRRAGEPSRDHVPPSNTQRRRRSNIADDDEPEEDDGEGLNWEHLGRFACIPNNTRPAVAGFLLGPLSVQKRARKIIVRRAALKTSNLRETRPEVLQAGDIEKSENANLTTLCTQILARLKKVRNDTIKIVEAKTRDDMTEKEQEQLLDDYGISPDMGISYFKFVINPRSFGQTIENMFYVSFLIRDGKVGIQMDEHGSPFLIPQSSERAEKQDGAAKHQAVLAIDMDIWDELIQLYDIKEPMIKHRQEVDHSNVGAKGWYA